MLLQRPTWPRVTGTVQRNSLLSDSLDTQKAIEQTNKRFFKNRQFLISIQLWTNPRNKQTTLSLQRNSIETTSTPTNQAQQKRKKRKIWKIHGDEQSNNWKKKKRKKKENHDTSNTFNYSFFFFASFLLLYLNCIAITSLYQHHKLENDFYHPHFSIENLQISPLPE